MPLTEKEKHGIAEFLHRLDKSDLVSLAQTVTSRLILPETSSEAVAAIILHTDKPEDLLRRRKVKKEFLFKYLHAKRVQGVEASSEKLGIINHVLQLWGSSPVLNAAGAVGGGGPDLVCEDSCSLPEAPAPSRNTSYSSLCSLDLYNPPSMLGSAVSQGSSSQNHPPNLGLILNRSHSTSHEDASEILQMRRTDSSWSMMTDENDPPPSLMVPPSSAEPGQATVGSKASASIDVSSSSNLSLLAAVAKQNPFTAGHQVTESRIAPNESLSGPQIQDLADTFVKWYYELMNNLTASPNSSSSLALTSEPSSASSSVTSSSSNTSSSTGGASTPDFRPDHFWGDASAKICLQNANQNSELIQVENNAKEVCSVLIDIVEKYRLTYNPNLCREGVSGQMDPHGLVVVSACGTLHNGPNCCGTFHQQFGLIRDPFEGNNWKIKFTHANLVSKNTVQEIPSLQSFSAQQFQQLQEQQQQQGELSSAMALS